MCVEVFRGVYVLVVCVEGVYVCVCVCLNMYVICEVILLYSDTSITIFRCVHIDADRGLTVLARSIYIS